MLGGVFVGRTSSFCWTSADNVLLAQKAAPMTDISCGDLPRDPEDSVGIGCGHDRARSPESLPVYPKPDSHDTDADADEDDPDPFTRAVPEEICKKDRRASTVSLPWKTPFKPLRLGFGFYPDHGCEDGLPAHGSVLHQTCPFQLAAVSQRQNQPQCSDRAASLHSAPPRRLWPR
jgi:hypothetical protein